MYLSIPSTKEDGRDKNVHFLVQLTVTVQQNFSNNAARLANMRATRSSNAAVNCVVEAKTTP
jgi:hypothetical protein